MTIATQTSKHLYAGDGAQTVFPYTFKIFAASDMVVIRRAVNGTETTLTLTTHYTVSGVGSDAGGNVTLVGTHAASPPAVGEKLLVKRVVPLTQNTDWVDNDPFPAAVIENAVDRAVCIAQQQQEVLNRCLKVGETSSLSGTIDPDQIAANAAASQTNANAAAASAAQAAASAASINPANLVPVSSKGQPNGVASLGSDGKVPSGQLPTIWQTTAAFTRTGAGSGTVTDNAANQALFCPGRPLRALSGSTYTYHIVTAYSAGTVTVAGPALPTTIDALAYGDVSRVVQETFNFSGYFADGADSALIERDLLTRYLWRLGKAYCVWFAVRPLVDDSGVAQPRVNVTCAGFAVSTSNSNAGLAVNDIQWVSTTTDISSANYDIAWGEILEVAVDANGTNANARDLTVVAVFVLE